MAPAQTKGAAKLRELLASPDKILVAPGVHDGLTARIALNAGFDALYMVSLVDPALLVTKWQNTN